MSVIYRHRTTNREIEVMIYLIDETNKDKVIKWLDSRIHNPWHTSSTGHAGGRGELIAIYRPHKETFYVSPGRVVGIYTDTNEICHIEKSVFLKHFDKVMSLPPVMTQPQTYTPRDTPGFNPVQAIRYVNGHNNRSVIDFLEGCGGLSIASMMYSGTITFYPDVSAIEVLLRSGYASEALLINSDCWITVRERENDLPLLVVYTDEEFAKIFSQYSSPTPPPKEDTVPETTSFIDFDPDTEYGQHRIKVLDALAIVRSSPTDAHFDLATTEIMDLLASAYNEGFDFGMSTGQVNPYEDRN